MTRSRAQHVVSPSANRVRACIAVVCTITSLAASTRAPAQVAAFAARSGSPALRTCIDTLSPGKFTRSVAYIEAMPTAGVPVSLAPWGDSVAREIATALRRTIAHDTGMVAPGEPAFTWRSLAQTVVVSVDRSGRARILGFAPRVPGDTSTILQRIADQVVARMPTMPLPSDAPDSAVFGLQFIAPGFDHAGHPERVDAHAPFPVASILQPWVDRATIVKQGHTEYPEWLRSTGGSGRVWIEVQLDDTGHPDMTTAHAVWKGAGPEPTTGQLGATYRALVAHAMEAVRTATFSPASIGGCAMPSSFLFIQEFDFKS